MRPVESQYTKWVYPIPIDDMQTAIADGSYLEIGDPILYQPLFWPHRRQINKLDILVAGCGTVQAAYYACRNPNWNVTGIDLSDTSLAHQNKLKRRHGLKNLRLKKCDVTKAAMLRESYDFIVCTGVLHHLPDPDEGLAALRDVLRPDGLINLMVYSKSLRLGVYLMQDVFRILGLQQTKEDVEIVKSTLNSLSPEHVVRRYTNNAGDLYYDAAFVDTFLHSQDRAFYVNEVYEFTRKAGLEFLTWCDPVEYSLEAAVPETHPLCSKLRGLTPETAAHVCDLLTQMRGTHRWVAAHPDYVKKVRIPFETDEFFNCIIVPHKSTRIIQKADPQTNQNLICERGNKSYEMNFLVSEIIKRANGVKSISQAVSEMNLSAASKEKLLSLARVQFQSLWRQGHLYVLLPEQKPEKW